MATHAIGPRILIVRPSVSINEFATGDKIALLEYGETESARGSPVAPRDARCANAETASGPDPSTRRVLLARRTSAFFLGSHRRKFDATFLPGFLARLRFGAADQFQQANRPAAQVHFVAGEESFRVRQKTGWIRCIQDQLPFDLFLAWQNKGNRLVMGIEQKQKGIVANRFAMEAQHVHHVAAQEHAQAADEGRSPLLLAHLVAAGIEPHHVANLRAGDAASLEKFRPPENRVRPAELDQVSGKLQELVLPVVAVPVEPTERVVLTINIVVAILRASPFVAAAEHGHAL